MCKGNLRLSLCYFVSAWASGCCNGLPDACDQSNPCPAGSDCVSGICVQRVDLGIVDMSPPSDMSSAPDLGPHALIWTAEQSGVPTNLYAVWGSGPNDVYAVGAGGIILHSTGKGDWASQTSNTPSDLLAVWGSGPNDVYAVGAGGVIDHRKGGQWALGASGVSSDLDGVWGSGPNDVYVAGDVGVILHFEGMQWSSQTPSGTMLTLRAVWGSGPNDVYVVGGLLSLYSSDKGQTWSSRGLAATPLSVWGFQATDVYFGAQFGIIQHTTTGNNGWTNEDNAAKVNLHGVWGWDQNNSHHVYMAGERGVLMQSTGNADWLTNTIDIDRHDFYGIWGSGEYNIYIVGTGGSIFHGR